LLPRSARRAVARAPALALSDGGRGRTAKQHEHSLVMLWRRGVGIGRVPDIGLIEDLPAGAFNEAFETGRGEDPVVGRIIVRLARLDEITDRQVADRRALGPRESGDL